MYIDNNKLQFSNENKYLNIDYNNSNKIGLINLGSTCYISSIIQILFYINNFKD